MSDIKISVILPVYNVEKYLKKCLDSLVGQKLSSVEFICVNDGSTDSSLTILNEYAGKDSRFVVVSQANAGQGAARHKGLELSKGKYIVFVDPDDWIEDDALEKIYNKFVETNADVVQYDFQYYYEYSGAYKSCDFVKKLKKNHGVNLKKRGYYNCHDAKKSCLYGFGFQVWNKAYSKDFLVKNNIKFAKGTISEDQLFTQAVILQAKKIYYIFEPLYVYRYRKGSSSHLISDKCFVIFENIDLLKEYMSEHNLLSEFEPALHSYMVEVLAIYYKGIPNNSLDRFCDLCQKYLTGKEYKKMLDIVNQKNSFLENIFSLKKKFKRGVKYRVITILGLKFERKVI